MSRIRVTAAIAAAAIAATALAGGPASAGDATAAGCGNWQDVAGASAYIRNIATNAPGGGVQLEKQWCADPDGGHWTYRTAMLIYGPLRANTRAVAGVYGAPGVDEYCAVLPEEEPDRFCATPGIGGATAIRGVVQEWRDGGWHTYAIGEWPAGFAADVHSEDWDGVRTDDREWSVATPGDTWDL